MLNVVDDVTKECLRAVADASIGGRRGVRQPAELIPERGKPGMMVSDNDTERTSNAVLAWCREIGVITTGIDTQRLVTRPRRPPRPN